MDFTGLSTSPSIIHHTRALTRDTAEVSCFLEHPGQVAGVLVLLMEPVHLHPLRQKVVANLSVPQPT